MDAAWTRRIGELRHRATYEEDMAFRALVYQAKGRCDYQTARILLGTFSDAEDYGVQEAVVSVLASAPPETYLRALFEEIPRLLREAPEWAEVLIGREIANAPDLVISVASTFDRSAQQRLAAAIAAQEDLMADEPNARKVLQALGGA